MLSNYEGEKDDYNYISKKINYDQGFYEDLRSTPVSKKLFFFFKDMFMSMSKSVSVCVGYYL